MTTSKISKVKWSIGGYGRLSKEDGDDRESQSISGQKQIITDYIKNTNEDFSNIEFYIDDGYTGTNFERPSIQKLLSDIEKGKINCVIVKDLSRFGRDYINVGYYLERYFPDNNIRFIAINDNIDSYKRDYDMLLPVKNIFNQQYAFDISTKVQSAFKAKQKRGKFVGAFTSYGYLKNPNDRNKLVVDEYASQIIKKIFDMYSNGIGQIKIAKILNDEGVLCPSEYKKQSGMNYRNSNRNNLTNYWTYSTIHRILKNEIYVGTMVQNKTKRRMKGKAIHRPEDEWIKVPNTHEGIIDKELFERVQKLLSKNTRQIDFEQNVSIFAGFLKCADCKRAMAKNVRGKVNYFICGSYKRYGGSICTSHTIREDKLYEIVLDYLNLIISKLTNLEKIVKAQEKSNKVVNNFDNEIEKNKMALDRIYSLKKGIYEDYKEKILSKDDYLQYKKDYEKDEDFYKKKIDMLEEQMINDNDNIFDNEWVKNFLKNKKIDKLDRLIVVDSIDEILIGENKNVDIILTCTNEVKNILNEISADV